MCRLRGSVTVLTLTGEFDITNVTISSEPLAGLGTSPAHPQPLSLILDLASVTFMDSFGLTALMAGVAAVLTAGHRVAFTDAPRPLQCLFGVAASRGWLPDGLEALPGPLPAQNSTAS